MKKSNIRQYGYFLPILEGADESIVRRICQRELDRFIKSMKDEGASIQEPIKWFRKAGCAELNDPPIVGWKVTIAHTFAV